MLQIKMPVSLSYHHLFLHLFRLLQFRFLVSDIINSLLYFLFLGVKLTLNDSITSYYKCSCLREVIQTFYNYLKQELS